MVMKCTSPTWCDESSQCFGCWFAECDPETNWIEPGREIVVTRHKAEEMIRAGLAIKVREVTDFQSNR
jgi:hypothetical protein